MKRMKVMTILGTRPEIIRLSRIIALCEECFEHKLVHTGQNYDYRLGGIFLEELGIRKPDYYLDCAGDNLGQTIGRIIERSYEVLLKERPDAVLILGDTNSSLSAIAAGRLHIPIFHLEAGNRCWDMYVSEMENRRILDCISDINICYTEQARLQLLKEGKDPKTLFVVGSPMQEVLSFYRERIEKSDVLEQLGLRKGEYLLASVHREENVDDPDAFRNIFAAIEEAAAYKKLPVLLSTHPRTKRWIEERGLSFSKNIIPMPPFGFFDYCCLERNSSAVLSDSGTLSEESMMLSFPAILLRTSTERPEAFDAGGMLLGGVTPEEVLRALDVLEKTKYKEFTKPESYTIKDVSRKVVRIIESYTKVVNLTTWRNNR